MHFWMNWGYKKKCRTGLTPPPLYGNFHTFFFFFEPFPFAFLIPLRIYHFFWLHLMMILMPLCCNIVLAGPPIKPSISSSDQIVVSIIWYYIESFVSGDAWPGWESVTATLPRCEVRCPAVEVESVEHNASLVRPRCSTLGESGVSRHSWR